VITAHHLFKTYQIKPILVDVSLHIGSGDRVGLVGPNGSGKTTLMRILARKEAPDAGVVTRHPTELRVGFLDQGLESPTGMSIQQLFEADTSGSRNPEAHLIDLAEKIAADPEQEDLRSAYDDALMRLNSLIKQAARVEETLEKLGLGNLPRDQPLNTLSGGQQSRLALARIILQEPDMLLLDEPTNHLDITMLEWLEGWLKKFQGGVLIVSHDRTFLDNTVNKILDLEPETHTLKLYSGNYSAYLEQYLSARNRQEAIYRNEEAEIRRLRQDINRTKQQALRVELSTTSRQPGVRRYAKKVARKAKSREKKLDRYLESEERVEKPGQTWQMKMDFVESSHLSQNALRCEDLSVGYAKNSPLVEKVDLHMKTGGRIVLTGPNGSGKTTLLRTIAGELQPLSGKVWLGASVRLGYMSQEQRLDPNQSALEMIQSCAPFNETEARSFLHFYLFTGDQPLRPSQELSYGERARLSLALLVAQGCNFLLLDEPINHLDIPSRARFEQALNQFTGTVLAVVHDRYFIHRYATIVWKIINRKLFQEQIKLTT
jgi:ATP-binding cassette, subfamily F, member 3